MSYLCRTFRGFVGTGTVFVKLEQDFDSGIDVHQVRNPSYVIRTRFRRRSCSSIQNVEYTNWIVVGVTRVGSGRKESLRLQYIPTAEWGAARPGNSEGKTPMGRALGVRRHLVACAHELFFEPLQASPQLLWHAMGETHIDSKACVQLSPFHRHRTCYNHVFPF